MATAWRAHQTFCSKRLEMIDLLLLCGWAMWLPFQFIRPNMDMVKYYYPAYLVFIILLPFFFAVFVKKKISIEGCLKSTRFLFWILISILLACFYYYQMGDYLLVSTTGALFFKFFHLLKIVYFKYSLYYLWPFLLACFVVFACSRRGSRFLHLFLCSMFCIVPINIGLDWNQAKADYRTVEIWNSYGEKGVRETARYVSQFLEDGAVISVRGDIEYYLVHKHGIRLSDNVRPDELLLLLDAWAPVVLEPGQLREESNEYAPIEIFVIDYVTRRIVGHTEKNLFEILRRYFVYDRKIGNFFIYRVKESSVSTRGARG
jgi:hypothetical protein